LSPPCSRRSTRSGALDPGLLAALDANAVAYGKARDTWSADMACGDLPEGEVALDRPRSFGARRPLPRAVAERLTRLRQALGGKSGPWGGCPLEPEVLLRLARNPPPDAGALADVPGVGPAVAHGYGPRPSSPKTSSCSSRRSRWCPRARR